MDEIRIIEKNSDQLIYLVKDFRNVLNNLNNSSRSCSFEEAEEEAEDYFSPNKKVVGLYRKKELIGFSVLKTEDGLWWLDWIFIKPEYRGYTNASVLFDYCEKFAAESGNNQLYIWVHPDNDRMLKFLKKKGYDILNLIEVKKRKNSVKNKIKILNNELWY